MASRKGRASFRSSVQFSVTDEEIDRMIRDVGVPKTSPTRYLALIIFCSSSFAQVVVWNTWGPISKAAMFAFESWDSGTVAMFSNWGSVCIVILVGPVCWLLDEKGLKYNSVLATGLCCLGAGLRCLPVDEKLFTWLSHIGGILNGIGGVIFGPAILLLSSSWFPAHERTSATGIMSAMSYFGMAASYIIGPAFVTPPNPNYKVTNIFVAMSPQVTCTSGILSGEEPPLHTIPRVLDSRWLSSQV